MSVNTKIGFSREALKSIKCLTFFVFENYAVNCRTGQEAILGSLSNARGTRRKGTKLKRHPAWWNKQLICLGKNLKPDTHWVKTIKFDDNCWMFMVQEDDDVNWIIAWEPYCSGETNCKTENKNPLETPAVPTTGSNYWRDVALV